ncbi:M55 family metallopeptidase [Clostridium grantii]|uniref:D-amino peptidase n=1 Tax=Clostridium grantii DSM 8605 TaxID=1121316 RepID=A0A1M5XQG7_9CLOT|nr:M55 family metallopeptidase [Clostridium grantii]SHI02077.1 D-amino peptidase [Clostridium grantii DSM 8605]
MKIYLSVDIEGVTGVTHWDETEKNKGDYSPFMEQMTKETKAACDGAINAGAKEIIIKDAHDSGRNINHNDLPQCTKLIRGWSGHPFSMVQDIDNTYDAAMFIGYHSCSHSDKNPLSHTMHPFSINYIKINGVYASEFLLHAYAAAYVGVPVVMVSGDEGLSEEVKIINSNIHTVSVKQGIGASTVSIHPEVAIDKIKKQAEVSLSNIKECKIKLPEKFIVEISYVNHVKAYRSSFYPGMKRISETEVVFETKDYLSVMSMIQFLVS